MSEFLIPPVIYLMAAVIAPPLSKQLGLGSVLGYLIAGFVIGPATGLVGGEAQDVQHFAEFGVVMMLFLVGLELEPKKLWSMRGQLLGLGGLQVLATTGALAGAAVALGLEWRVGLIVGATLALSSTAIVLQTFAEKGVMRSGAGQAGFSVLLFQDIAVIPILALIPLLAPLAFDFGAATDASAFFGDEAPALAETAHGSADWMHALPVWSRGLVALGAVILAAVAGRFATPFAFRYIAAARLRETFTAGALLLVIGIAALMTQVGLSPALGVFIAGVVLADSAFRHELETSIEPFKGLLLGLFFLTVGAAINVRLLMAEAPSLLGLAAGLMLAKFLVLWLLGRIFGLPRGDGMLFALGLAQAGEFGFVLLSFAVGAEALDADLAERLVLVIALTMLMTPLGFILYDRVLSPRMNPPADGGEESGDQDFAHHEYPVVIAGVGRFGQVVNRLLLAAGHQTIVLDNRAPLVDGLRKFGVTAYYGDPTRHALLHAAGLEHARLLIVAIDDGAAALALVRHVRETYPNVTVIARATDRLHAYRVRSAGAHHVVRELFGSSLEVGRIALEALGDHSVEARSRARAFAAHDEKALADLFEKWDEEGGLTNPAYITRAEAAAQILEHTMRYDFAARGQAVDDAGDGPAELGAAAEGRKEKR